MRISDWSSDVCSSDLPDEALRNIQRGILAVRCRRGAVGVQCGGRGALNEKATIPSCGRIRRIYPRIYRPVPQERRRRSPIGGATIHLIIGREPVADAGGREIGRAHVELQSLKRISTAVFGL